MPGQNDEPVVCRPAAGDESRTKAHAESNKRGRRNVMPNGFKRQTVHDVSQTKPVRRKRLAIVDTVLLGEFLRGRHASPSVDERNTVLEAIKSQHKTNFTFRFRSREPR